MRTLTATWRSGYAADCKSKPIANNTNQIDILSYQDIPRTECESDNSPNWPHNGTDLFVSLSRTAGILDMPVAEVSRLRDNHAFPHNYNFDTVAKDGRPAIKRGLYFWFDEIKLWARRAGDFGNRGDPPPDKKETAALAGTRRDGIDRISTNNANQTPRIKQIGTPCVECRWFDALDRSKWVRARRCSACNLSATRDPGRDCQLFAKIGGGS